MKGQAVFPKTTGGEHKQHTLFVLATCHDSLHSRPRWNVPILLTRIGYRAAAVGTKEPGEVWRAVLGIFPKVIDTARHVAKHKATATEAISALGTCVSIPSNHTIERIERGSRRWHGAARAVRVATSFRSRHIRFPLQNGEGVVIVVAAHSRAAWR